MRHPSCSSCEELQHTSPTQVFWRCRWHCEEPGGEVIRCHVLPRTPACQHHRQVLDVPRRLSELAVYNLTAAPVRLGVAS